MLHDANLLQFYTVLRNFICCAYSNSSFCFLRLHSMLCDTGSKQPVRETQRRKRIEISFDFISFSSYENHRFFNTKIWIIWKMNVADLCNLSARFYCCYLLHKQMAHAHRTWLPWLRFYNFVICILLTFNFFWFHSFNARRHSTATTKTEFHVI